MMLEYGNREGSLSNSYEHQDEKKEKSKKKRVNEKIKRGVGRSSHELETPYPGGMSTSTRHSRFHACKKIPATATGGEGIFFFFFVVELVSGGCYQWGIPCLLCLNNSAPKLFEFRIKIRS